MSGFAWNLETQLWKAENEVWKELIQAKPSAARWRHNKICHYDKLYDLFVKDRATGEGVMSAREKVLQWEREENDNLIDLNDGVDEFSLNFEPISPVSTPFQATSQTATSSKSSKRKASMLDVMDKHIESINSGINNVAQAIKEGNAIAEKGIAVVERARPRCCTEEEEFAELQNI